MLDKHAKTLELDKILALLAARTNIGAAAEAALDLTPSSDLSEIVSRLGETDDATRLISYYSAPSFGRASAVNGQLRRAESGGTLSMHDLLLIAEDLRVSRSLKEWRERCEGCIAPHLDGYFDRLYINRYLEDRIFSSILSDEEMSDTASPALSDIRRKIRTKGQSVRDRLDKIIHSSQSKFLQEAIITQRDGRFVVPVRSECRGELPGLVHDTSSSGATLFVEPMPVVELNNEIRVLETKEREEIERILAELSAEAASFSDMILSAYDGITALDLIFAKAELGISMRGTVPKITDTGRLYLKNARHPLIDRKKVVPITVSLGDAFSTLIITGPNTGGKTVTLKTLGLLSLMATCGLLIPADEGSEIPVFDHILADIGDEQSIEQSFSTFSAHMTNIVSILDTASCYSLVLIDELGAGTDPVEGAALATAVLMKLKENGARTVATTHYAELKSYALETPGVCNACCEFDLETLKPTYRLIIGAPGRSNAFAVSRRLGLSEDILQMAERLVSDQDRQFEHVIEVLDRARKAAEDERNEAETLRREMEQSRKKHREETMRLEKERMAILDRARSEARDIVERTRSRSEAMLDEMERLRKEKEGSDADRIRRARDAARAGMREAESIADPVDPILDMHEPLPRDLVIGDIVVVNDIRKQGEVIALPKADGTVLVRIGMMKTSVALNNLSLVSKERLEAAARKGGKRNISSHRPEKVERSATTELDLRGMNADEAIMELDRAIDAAVLSGVGMMTVIHGKGTGVLRKAVHDYLRGHKSVQSFRLGVFGEGESGVTVIELQ